MGSGGSSADDGVAMAVVEAVAEAEGVDEAALTPPLASVVDPDALERFVRTADDGVAVEFEYVDWVVEVRGSGDVSLREP